MNFSRQVIIVIDNLAGGITNGFDGISIVANVFICMWKLLFILSLFLIDEFKKKYVLVLIFTGQCILIVDRKWINSTCLSQLFQSWQFMYIWVYLVG